jgi:protein-disulfide isomerase
VDRFVGRWTGAGSLSASYFNRDTSPRTGVLVKRLLSKGQFEVTWRARPARFQHWRETRVEVVVKELLAKYGDKGSLAYRDFPLKQIHPQAEIAAEASRCAGEQGKYWGYHDQLFTASKLDPDAIAEYARTLKLDDKQFDSCLSNEKYRGDIEKDSREGTQAGITGTPGFFINGVALSGSRPAESLARIIYEELSRK